MTSRKILSGLVSVQPDKNDAQNLEVLLREAYNNRGVLLSKLREVDHNLGVLLSKLGEEYNNLGVLLSKQPGREVDAEQAYRDAIKFKDTRAYRNLGILLRKQPDRWSESRQAFLMAIIHGDSHSWLELGRLLRLQKKATKSEKRSGIIRDIFICYRNAIKLGVLSAYEDIELHLKHACGPSALVRFYAHATARGFEQYWEPYGDCLANQTGQEVHAERAYKRHLSTHAHLRGDQEQAWARVCGKLGVLLSKQRGRELEAESYLQDAIDEGLVSANLDLADLIRRQPSRKGEALSLYTTGIQEASWRVLQRDSRRAKSKYCNMVGELLREQPGHEDEAESYFKQALDAGGLDGIVHHNLANLLRMQSGRVEDSRQHYLKAIDRDIFEAYHDLGLLEHGCGRLREARRLYKQAINHGVSRAHLSLAHLLRGDPERRTTACIHYHNALTRGFDDALFPLGTLLLQMDAPLAHEQARVCFESCIAREHDFVRAGMVLHSQMGQEDALGTCWQILGDRARAAKPGSGLWAESLQREHPALPGYLRAYIAHLQDGKARARALQELYEWLPTRNAEGFQIQIASQPRISPAYLSWWLLYSELLRTAFFDARAAGYQPWIDQLLEHWLAVTGKLNEILQQAKEWQDGLTLGRVMSALVDERRFPKSEFDRIISHENLTRAFTSMRLEPSASTSSSVHVCAEQFNAALFAWTKLRSCVDHAGFQATLPEKVREDLSDASKIGIEEQLQEKVRALCDSLLGVNPSNHPHCDKVSDQALARLHRFHRHYHEFEIPLDHHPLAGDRHMRYRARHDLVLLWALDLVTFPLKRNQAHVLDPDHPVFARIFEALMVSHAIGRFLIDRHPTSTLPLEHPDQLRSLFERQCPSDTRVAILTPCSSFFVWLVFEPEPTRTRIVLVPTGARDHMGVPFTMRKWQETYKEHIEDPRCSDHQRELDAAADVEAWVKPAKCWLEPLATLHEHLPTHDTPSHLAVRLADVLTDTNLVGLSHTDAIYNKVREEFEHVPRVDLQLTSIFSLLPS